MRRRKSPAASRRVHLGIDESDQVAQVVIAEHHADLAAVLLPAIRPIDGLRLRPCRRSVRSSTPLSVAAQSKPASAASWKTSSETEPSDGHRPDRRDAEFCVHVFARHVKLLARVLRIAESRRQRHARMRHARRYRNRTPAAGSDDRTAWSRFRSGPTRPASRYSGITCPTISRCFSPISA